MVAGLTSGSLSTEIPDMFNEADDAKGQGISHTIITIDADAISGAEGRARLDRLSESVNETGGRTPGASRIHPSKISDEKCQIAPAVVEELNVWAEKLGINSRI
jgi:(2R)-3-sulfolactate dehydrogenase (NADP+)